MNYAQLFFSIGSVVCGLKSAHLWYKASQVTSAPMSARFGNPAPAEPVAAQADWIGGLLQSAKESGDLNRRAAIWTAASVGFTAIATVVGVATQLLVH